MDEIRDYYEERSLVNHAALGEVQKVSIGSNKDWAIAEFKGRRLQNGRFFGR